MNRSDVRACLYSLITALIILAKPLAAAAGCGATFNVTFNPDGKSVSVQSSKDLSHAILYFCDGSSIKYDSQSGLNNSYSSTKVIRAALVKAGCSSQTVESNKCVDCMGVPDGEAKVDLCGMCGGDNSSCKDCQGVPNGGAVIDACGVCGGDNSSCTGCDSIPNSGKALDACDVCGGDDSSCKDCMGVPNGGAVVDSCGVCGGNDTTCKDCAGVVNGTTKVDECGLCGGSSTAPCITIQCVGTMDSCGVCNGTNTCLDCAGIPNGGTEIDCCGVCGGDGSTCLDKCKVYKLKSTKKQAVSRLNKLYKSVVKYSTRESQCLSDKTAAKKRLAAAKKLLKTTISMLNEYFADTLKVCDTVYCSKVNLASVNKTLKRNTTRLFEMSRASQYGAGKACGQTGKRNGNNRVSSSRNDYNGANGSLNRFPDLVCR